MGWIWAGDKRGTGVGLDSSVARGSKVCQGGQGKQGYQELLRGARGQEWQGVPWVIRCQGCKEHEHL